MSNLVQSSACWPLTGMRSVRVCKTMSAEPSTASATEAAITTEAMISLQIVKLRYSCNTFNLEVAMLHRDL